MAVDTETRRRSVHGYTHPAIILPVADASIDAADRQHVCGLYASVVVERRGYVSWAEFEMPAYARRGFASWVEFEIPGSSVRGIISFVEFEVPAIIAIDGDFMDGPYWAGYFNVLCTNELMSSWKDEEVILLADAHDQHRSFYIWSDDRNQWVKLYLKASGISKEADVLGPCRAAHFHRVYYSNSLPDQGLEDQIILLIDTEGKAKSFYIWSSGSWVKLLLKP